MALYPFVIGYSHPRLLAQEFDAKTSPLFFFFFLGLLDISAFWAALSLGMEAEGERGV